MRPGVRPGRRPAGRGLDADLAARHPQPVRARRAGAVAAAGAAQQAAGADRHRRRRPVRSSSTSRSPRRTAWARTAWSSAPPARASPSCCARSCSAWPLTHSSEVLNFVLVDFKGGATFARPRRGCRTRRGDHQPGGRAAAGRPDERRAQRRAGPPAGAAAHGRQLRLAARLRRRPGRRTARAAAAAAHPARGLRRVLRAALGASPTSSTCSSRSGGSAGRSACTCCSPRSGWRRAGCAGWTRTCRTGSACARSPPRSRASVLGVPDAYELPPQPGHGYLKFDTEPHDPVQGGVRVRPGVHGPGHRAAAPGEAGRSCRYGHRLRPAGPRCGRRPTRLEPRAESVDSLLDVVVAQLAGHGAPAHQVWLPPLDVPPTLDQLLAPAGHRRHGTGCTVESEDWRGRLPGGHRDRGPAVRAAPRPACGRTSRRPRDTSAVVGAPQSGKSTMLRTLICSLALTHTPREVQFYCLDFGGGSLSGADARCRTSAAWPAGWTPTRVRRTVAEVQSLLARRETGVRRPGHRVDVRVPPDAGQRRDRRGPVRRRVPGRRRLAHAAPGVRASSSRRSSAVAARGLGYGVHVLAAAGKWSEFRPAIRDLFGTRLELRLGDPCDSEIDRRLAANVPEGSPGRGITREGLHFLTALPRIDSQPSADSLADGVRKLAEAVAVAWPGEPAPRVRLLPDVLPMRALPGVTQTGTGIPIGIDESTLAPVQLDFGADAALPGLRRHRVRQVEPAAADRRERGRALPARPGPADLHRLPPVAARTRGNRAPDRLRRVVGRRGPGHQRRPRGAGPAAAAARRDPGPVAQPVLVAGLGPVRARRRLRPRRRA